MTKFTLGINNCFAVKRWPEPEVWAKIVASDIELSTVQFTYDLLDPGTYTPALTEIVGETRDALKKYGISIHSCFTGLAMYSFNLLTHPYQTMRTDGINWHEKGIILASKLGAKGSGGHLAALSCEDLKNKERRKYLESCLIDALSHLTRIAASLGQEFFLWEPMPISREPPCTISEAKRLLKKANKVAKIPVKLCIDTGHQCPWDVTSAPDLDIYNWLKELAQESPVIHVQQTDGKEDRHWPFTPKYNKNGIIYPKKILEAIDDSGAKETLLALEIIHPFEARESQILEDLKLSVEYWKEYL